MRTPEKSVRKRGCMNSATSADKRSPPVSSARMAASVSGPGLGAGSGAAALGRCAIGARWMPDAARPPPPPRRAGPGIETTRRAVASASRSALSPGRETAMARCTRMGDEPRDELSGRRRGSGGARLDISDRHRELRLERTVAAGLAVFPPDRGDQLDLAHRQPALERKQLRMPGHVAELAARERAAAGHLLHQRVARAMVAELARENLVPCDLVRRPELDHDVHAAPERLVDAVAGVRGDEQDAFEAFDPLKQEVGLEVGIAVVGVADVGAPRHQGIAFVEQQDAVAILGGGDGTVEILLRLADVLADRRRQIDPEQDLAEVGRQAPGRERLAGAARADEQRADAGPARLARDRERLPVATAQGERREILRRELVEDEEIVRGRR